MTQLAVREIVQKTFDSVLTSLANGQRVELRNFGVFDLKVRAARQARNLSTGDSVQVPEKIVVAFKPSKEMERRVAVSGKDNRFEVSGFMPHAREEMKKQTNSERDLDTK